MAWYSTLLSPLVSTIGGYFKDKQKNKADKSKRKDELTQAKHEASVERIKRGDKAEADYDRIAQQAKKNTMMDEILILWTLVIVTLLFIPATAPIATAGFVALGTAPVWFQLIFIGCYISTLGLRFLFSGRTLLGKVVK